MSGAMARYPAAASASNWCRHEYQHSESRALRHLHDLELTSKPGSPTMAMYMSFSTVVTCMRAGLYQTKNGLLVFLGSLRSRKSMTLAEISSSTPFDRSSVSGPWSWQVWFFSVPSEEWHQRTGRGGVRQVAVLGSTEPGTSARPGIGV